MTTVWSPDDSHPQRTRPEAGNGVAGTNRNVEACHAARVHNPRRFTGGRPTVKGGPGGVLDQPDTERPSRLDPEAGGDNSPVSKRGGYRPVDEFDDRSASAAGLATSIGWSKQENSPALAKTSICCQECSPDSAAQNRIHGRGVLDFRARDMENDRCSSHRCSW